MLDIGDNLSNTRAIILESSDIIAPIQLNLFPLMFLACAFPTGVVVVRSTFQGALEGSGMVQALVGMTLNGPGCPTAQELPRVG